MSISIDKDSNENFDEIVYFFFWLILFLSLSYFTICQTLQFFLEIDVKGIYNPQYLPNDFFALSTFLDDLKPSHLNLSFQICP